MLGSLQPVRGTGPITHTPGNAFATCGRFVCDRMVLYVTVTENGYVLTGRIGEAG